MSDRLPVWLAHKAHARSHQVQRCFVRNSGRLRRTEAFPWLRPPLRPVLTIEELTDVVTTLAQCNNCSHDVEQTQMKGTGEEGLRTSRTRQKRTSPTLVSFSPSTFPSARARELARRSLVLGPRHRDARVVASEAAHWCSVVPDREDSHMLIGWSKALYTSVELSGGYSIRRTLSVT